ncbi:MAG: hypothetical protein ACTSPV_10925 [Candidatus Hodarchaeales archaeon]
MEELNFYFLVGLNIFLPLVILYYIYSTKRNRDIKEISFSGSILVLWALRNFWFLIRSFGYYYDYLNRAIALDLALILILGFFWLAKALPLEWKNFGKIINFVHYGSATSLMIIAIPGSILLPPDSVRNDMNVGLSIVLAIYAVIYLLLTALRVMYLYKHKSLEHIMNFSKKYYFGILLGVTAVLSGDTIFLYILKDPVLKLMSPVIGFLVILGSLILGQFFPYLDFTKRIESGLMIVSAKNFEIEYLNETAEKCIPAEKLKGPIYFTDLWKDNENIIDAIEQVNESSRVVELGERIYNYDKKSLQHVKLTFYPLSNGNIGIVFLDSDQLEFLKQRRDFLLDIITHDIANVSQTMLLGLESMKTNRDDLEQTLDIVLLQNRRLEQLIFSAQNLLFIDRIAMSPSEKFPDFNTRFKNLIEEKREEYPDVMIDLINVDDLKGIKTTGNLKAGFSLLLDGIIHTLKGKEKRLLISTEIMNTKKQKIIFRFKGEEFTASLFQDYIQEDKSAMVASNPARINIIVASAVIQTNVGVISIEKLDEEEEDALTTQISVTIPYFD